MLLKWFGKPPYGYDHIDWMFSENNIFVSLFIIFVSLFIIFVSLKYPKL